MGKITVPTALLLSLLLYLRRHALVQYNVQQTGTAAQRD